MNGYSRLSIFVFALFIASAVISYEVQAQDVEAVTPNEEEVAAHLIGTMPVIRMDFKGFPELATFGEVPVELLVNKQGNVISVKLDDLNDDDADAKELSKAQRVLLRALIAEAKKTGMGLRFRPFEDQGHPVQARFETQIAIRDLNEKVVKHIPFPQIHDWSSIKIVLSRTGCFGTCPSYRVEVHGDGTVLYDGGSFVAIKGSHRASISRDTVSEMVEVFRVADYFSLKDKYIWAATDLPTYTTSISIDSRAKEITDYAGEHVGMPESVSKLEDAIDRLSGVERWTKGNSETVPALMQEKFDFRSPQASEILANVAQKGKADAVRDLVAAGVIVSTAPVQPRLGIAGTALENAAQRGDVEMLRALLTAGINPAAKTRALEHASLAGKMDAMRLLIGSGANPTAPDVLIGAAGSGMPAVVQEVLRYRPDVNSRGQGGTTALINCLGANHPNDRDVDLKEVVRILIDAGADPSIADNQGKTALIANSQDLQIAELLIAHGANVNARANNGVTPLLNAGTVELTRLLLEHGADPFAKTEQGETALDWANRMNRKDQAALLEAAMAGKKP
ncbi:MAG TPA: ankyrin repeat domain-containing protein [Candidatus Angelobacter sp.]|nr:ankyrin repeat domain-containing protein [Candidatus Angelobacter sp.]